MLRILHVIAQKPEMTGSGIFIQSLIREASLKNYKQAAIYGISAEDINSIEVLDKENQYPVFFETDELPFPVVGMSDVMPYKSTKYSELNDDMLKKWKDAFKKRIVQAVSEFKPDLIISHHLWLLTAYVKELCPDITVIAISHGTELRQLHLAYRFANYVKSGINKVEIILALNKYQKEKIASEYNIDVNKIHVTGVAYNSGVIYPNPTKIKSDRIKILYAGKLCHSKGVPSLLKAYNKLNVDRNKVELVMHTDGSGKEAELIRKMINNSTLPVDLRGIVPCNVFYETLRECDIFILPSFYEGLPLVVVEALASGLRVICTDLPGVKEWIGDEINKSGIIDYVQLPRIKNKDIPYEEDLPDFEERLKKVMEKKIKEVSDGKQFDIIKLRGFLEDKSWKSLFNKIEKIILNDKSRY